MPEPTFPIKTLAAGRYRLEGVVGQGGFATVYRATDTVLKVPRAIKVLSARAARREVIRRRLNAEARAMARISHPNVLQVYDIVSEQLPAGGGELHYVVMDFAPGGNLMDWTRAHGHMPPDLAMRYMVQVLSALAAAHAAGIVHRDVKPQNILLDSRGVALLADFGIALLAGDGELRATRTGVAMGSFAYMAPEQRLDARSVGPAADLYAVGSSLYYLVTGGNPVDLFAEPPSSERWQGLPDVLRDALVRATAHDPLARYPSARAFAQALLEALDHVGSEPLVALQPWDPSSFPEPSERFSQTGGAPSIGPTLARAGTTPEPGAVRAATRAAHTILEVLPQVGPGSTTPALSPEQIRSLGPLQRRLLRAPPTQDALLNERVAAEALTPPQEPAPPQEAAGGARVRWLAAALVLAIAGGGLWWAGGDEPGGAAPAGEGGAAAEGAGGELSAADGPAEGAAGEVGAAEEPAEGAAGEVGAAEGAEPGGAALGGEPGGGAVGDAEPAGSGAGDAEPAGGGVGDAELAGGGVGEDRAAGDGVAAASGAPGDGAAGGGVAAVGSVVSGTWTGTFATDVQIAVTLALSGSDEALAGVMESRAITVPGAPAVRYPVAGYFDAASGTLHLQDTTQHATAGSYTLHLSGDRLDGSIVLSAGGQRSLTLRRAKL